MALNNTRTLSSRYSAAPLESGDWMTHLWNWSQRVEVRQQHPDAVGATLGVHKVNRQVVEHDPELSEEDTCADVLPESRISINTFLEPQAVFSSLDQPPFDSVPNYSLVSLMLSTFEEMIV